MSSIHWHCRFFPVNSGSRRSLNRSSFQNRQKMKMFSTNGPLPIPIWISYGRIMQYHIYRFCSVYIYIYTYTCTFQSAYTIHENILPIRSITFHLPPGSRLPSCQIRCPNPASPAPAPLAPLPLSSGSAPATSSGNDQPGSGVRGWGWGG